MMSSTVYILDAQLFQFDIRTLGCEDILVWSIHTVSSTSGSNIYVHVQIFVYSATLNAYTLSLLCI